MKKSLLVLAASIAAAVSMNASAATTGTFNFQRSVISGTCEIATSSNNQAVILRTIESNCFPAANQFAGGKEFQITLTGCEAASLGTVAVAFDAPPPQATPSSLQIPVPPPALVYGCSISMPPLSSRW